MKPIVSGELYRLAGTLGVRARARIRVHRQDVDMEDTFIIPRTESRQGCLLSDLLIVLARAQIEAEEEIPSSKGT